MKEGTKLRVTITSEDGILLDDAKIVLAMDATYLEICYPFPGVINRLAIDTLQVGN